MEKEKAPRYLKGKQLTVLLNEEEHHTLKVYAAQLGKTIRQVVRDLIQRVLLQKDSR